MTTLQLIRLLCLTGKDFMQFQLATHTHYTVTETILDVCAGNEIHGITKWRIETKDNVLYIYNNKN